MNIPELEPLPTGPLEPEALDRLATAVAAEHLERLKTRRRGKHRIRRARTALIALAAQESAAAREWAEQQDSIDGRHG